MGGGWGICGDILHHEVGLGWVTGTEYVYENYCCGVGATECDISIFLFG